MSDRYRPELSDYHVELEARDGRFHAAIEELPEIEATGSTVESARKASRTAIRRHIETCEYRRVVYAFPKAEGYGRPLCWSITGPNGQLSHIFGTIHYPDPRLVELPEGVRVALEDSDAVWTETELDEERIEAIAAKFMLPEGETSEKLLGSQTVMMLRGLSVSRGWDYDELVRLKPFALLMRLVYSMSETDRDTQLDFYLARQARELEMEYGGLETISEQIRQFERGSPSKVVEAVRSFMQEVSLIDSDGGRYVEPILYVYLTGSARGLRELVLSGMGQAYDVLTFYGRNRMMAARIHRAMNEHPDKRYFFSCGAAHCVEACSVPDLLDLMGWQIERLE